MSIEKSYQPSEEEIKKGEEVMTDDRRAGSEGREATIQVGIEQAKKYAGESKHMEKAEEAMTEEQKALSEEREAVLFSGFDKGLEIENREKVEEINKKLKIVEEKISGFLGENLSTNVRCIPCSIYESFDVSYTRFNTIDNDKDFEKDLRSLSGDEDYENKADALKFMDNLANIVNSLARENFGVDKQFLSRVELAEFTSKDTDINVNDIMKRIEKGVKEELLIKK